MWNCITLPGVMNAAQNVPQCIHQFITDPFILKMAAGAVLEEIYEYVIQEMMIVSVKG